MKRLFLIPILLCTILSACGGQKDVLATPPFITVAPSLTTVPTLTTRPTKTPFPPTATLTPLPAYLTKHTLFDYNVIGDHSVYDFFFNGFPSWSRLIVYDDGQIIIPGETYKQKVLSPDEIEAFLSKLDKLGFFTLESNQKHDPTDKLYNFGNNYQKSYDGRLYCISVNTHKSRKLCVYEPDLQYVVPEMKNILQFLGNYEPQNMTLYSPDRLLLWVQVGRDSYNENLPSVATPWADDLPPLSSFRSITYIDGTPAKEIYSLFDNRNTGKVFFQNDKEYTVYFHIVLPHETVTNANQ